MTDVSSTVLNSETIPDVVDESVEDLDFWEHSIGLAEAGACELKGLLGEDLAGL